MLAYFLAKLHRVDPDIIVGHNMGSFALEVLQHRMAACKVPQWSRIGRLRRKDLPKVSISVCVCVCVCWRDWKAQKVLLLYSSTVQS